MQRQLKAMDAARELYGQKGLLWSQVTEPHEDPLPDYRHAAVKNNAEFLVQPVRPVVTTLCDDTSYEPEPVKARQLPPLPISDPAVKGPAKPKKSESRKQRKAKRKARQAWENARAAQAERMTAVSPISYYVTPSGLTKGVSKFYERNQIKNPHLKD